MMTEVEQTNGPTEDMIAEWKASGVVRRILLGDTHYYYRPINRAEYRTITTTAGNPGAGFGVSADANFQFEEQVVRVGVVWPKLGVEALQTIAAGIPSRLTELIMEASGWEEESQPELL